MQFILSPEFKSLVTFLPNRVHPIHNWYWYKEGFSSDLVQYFLDKFKPSFVFDPFCGVGTTLLTCKQNSICSAGIDSNLLCTFISKVKTQDYDLEELTSAVEIAKKWKPEKQKSLPQNKFLKKVFSKFSLGDTIFYKNKIQEIAPPYQDFLLLALIDSSIKSSYIYKDGSVLKIKKQSRPPLKILFRNKIKRMLRDLKAPLPKVPAEVNTGDARSLSLDSESVDCIITSPPYLNKIEYANIYKLELSLFFNHPVSQIKSHIGSEGAPNEKYSTLPLIAQNYFTDMEKVFSELFRVCKPDANLAVVIGGGCFPDQVVEADTILAKIAQETGFEIDKILVARNSWCTKKRTVKIRKIRESIILMKK